MCAIIVGGFDTGRGQVQHRYPRPLANNSRGGGAVRSANRDCAGVHVIALFATRSFLPSVGRALGAPSLCVQESGGRSIRWSKRQLLDGVNAPMGETVVDV